MDNDPVPDELTDGCIVIEAGCYEGAWTAKAAAKARCTIHAFEPATRAYTVAKVRLAGVPGVTLHNVALGKAAGTMVLHDCQRDGATSWTVGGPSETVTVVDAAQIVRELGTVDLMHLNAEGDELDILERLIDSGDIRRVRTILVQWHPRDDEVWRRIIRMEARLLETHVKEPRYCWGCWKLRERQADA